MRNLAPNSVKGDIVAAAGVFLMAPVVVRGVNTYTIGTNLLTWDETNSYLLSHIASTFGQVISNGAPGGMSFRCGNAGIPAYDFGLLLSCFTAMSMAQVELGMSVPTEKQDTSAKGINVAWFGNNGVIHGVADNLLIPVRSADVQHACRHAKVTLASFVDSKTFILAREGKYFTLENGNGEFVCSFAVPVSVIRSFPAFFAETVIQPSEIDRPELSGWDEQSPLGNIIAGVSASTNVEETLARYKEQTSLSSIVNRSDLICEPSVRYSNLEEFLGGICYTDQHEIVLAVNFRRNLFTYRPWFCGSVAERDALAVKANPKFAEFFDVKAECERIMRYSKTVTLRPLTAAQFDIKVFEAVKKAFYVMELQRIPLASTFGHVVIPENVLLSGLGTSAGESMFCVVPVGVIGNNIITINADGNMEAVHDAPWDNDGYFYDITEVCNALQ